MSDKPNLSVVSFPAPTPQTEGLIAALRACLTQAERGNATAFVLVAVNRDGTVLRANGRSDEYEAFKLIGLLQHESRNLSRMIDAHNEIVDHLDLDEAA